MRGLGFAWPLPDADCLAAGDRYLDLAARSYATGGLSDLAIARRTACQLGPRPVQWCDACWAVARHCAMAGASFTEIIDILVWLAAEAPAWPDDPDEIGAIARAAISEFSL